MSEEKYSQLKRIEHSLNNYRLSIQNNLKKLGCDEQEERFNFLYQKVFQANLSKKINRKKDQVVFGTGWLAAEGKISLEEKGATVKIALLK